MNDANKNQLQITPIHAFEDNYIWLLHNALNAVVVDPGDAKPVIAALERKKIDLSAILITHHHADHIGGVDELVAYCKSKNKQILIYAPHYESFAFDHIKVAENDSVHLPEIDQTFKVMWLPGHTLGHIAYINAQNLFCGDTLFGAGCGRLFEGTPEQMLNSLNRLKQLNNATKVYCTHEYTAKNIAFALTLEPDNVDLKSRQCFVQALRAQAKPSLPSTIGCELKTNPFLRCLESSIFRNSNANNDDELSVFTAIRMLRNHY